MTANPRTLRSEPFAQVGAVIRRDAGIIIDRWSRRVVAEHPDAARAHHDNLLDHLPHLLDELGQSLADSVDVCRHCRPALEHGEQRWGAGWSLAEVVQDYQLLRLVLVEYLEEALDRRLLSREVMALNLALDEAINASVDAYGRHRDEAARRQAEALREANRQKDDFLAVLGHEMRNPLAPIQNALHVLALRGHDPATLGWARGVIQRQVRHLKRMVDDLLDVSRISRGKVGISRERLDLAELVRTTAEDRRGSLAEAGLALQLDLPAEPVWVDGDPTRLAQVVGNLLHNAAKFTDPGGHVGVRVAAEGGRAVVAVRDTGIGIEPELLGRLFEPYVQADQSPQRDRGGLGLGLVLVRGLVRLHGGEVSAASEGLGRGAEVAFWLPRADGQAPPAGAAAPQEPGARALRVLIIEDERDTADTLRMVLELSGYQAEVAYSGAEGLEAVRRALPDVVLCDLGLPGLDGYAVAQALRADPRTASARLVAVSGYGSEADLRRGQEVGFEFHLTKPVDPAALEALLARWNVPGLGTDG
jgi:signal transduction histidine kinase